MPALEWLISLVTPHRCLGCEREGSLLCEGCLADEQDGVPSRCYRCKKMTTDSAVCEKCRKFSPLKHVWVANDYGDLAKALVYKLKFDRARAAANPIASRMAESLPYLPGTVITHVPTASSRRRMRGYDQSELIAQQLARITGGRHMTLLGRLGQTRQVGAKRLDRYKQMENAFIATKTGYLKNRSVLIVDDILTTGATIEEAARVLRRAGAARVDAVVFAQR